jgi:predicted SAM-dependent methyltransferase
MITSFLKLLNEVADSIEELLPEGVNKVYVPFRRFIGSIFSSWRKGRLAQFRFYVLCGHFFRGKKIKNYLKNHKTKKLQLGGGLHSKDQWLNVDIIYGDIYLNATRKFPLPDATFEYVFAEHFIEHFDFEQGSFILRECNRVLVPGGKIRLSTPDLKKLVDIYKNENPIVTRSKLLERHNRINNKQLKTMAQYFYDMYRMWGHKFIYDFQTLKMLLMESGFNKVTQVKFGESRDKNLRKLERHADVKWMKSGYVGVYEAVKP